MLSNRMFVHTKVFDKLWELQGGNDDALRELQKAILKNPQGYPVIKGTGGVRKIRISLDGRGKSGGARVLYIDFVSKGIVGLLYVYPKSEKDNIDHNEKKIIKTMAEQINKHWREK